MAFPRAAVLVRRARPARHPDAIEVRAHARREPLSAVCRDSLPLSKLAQIGSTRQSFGCLTSTLRTLLALVT